MKLRYGYLFSGVVTALIVLGSFIWTLPDGKLHIYFCSVGQGDAAYIQFPDGRDMVVDSGPNDQVLGCLGRHMPFWDRSIDLVVLTHPQQDHMKGLRSLVERYTIGRVLRSHVDATSDGFIELQRVLTSKNVPTSFIVSGDRVLLGDASLSFLWPSNDQVSKFTEADIAYERSEKTTADKNVLGAQTGDLNDYSVVFILKYGDFDVLFPGDADSHVEDHYMASQDASTVHSMFRDGVEIVKIPHHGSKTAMTKSFIDWVQPKAAVISVGKNSYGHPSKEALDLLHEAGSVIYRTDTSGDIEGVSDGVGWMVRTMK